MQKQLQQIVNNVLDENTDVFEACKLLYTARNEMYNGEKKAFSNHISKTKGFDKVIKKCAPMLLWYPRTDIDDDPELSKFHYWREEQKKKEV